MATNNGVEARIPPRPQSAEKGRTLPSGGDLIVHWRRPTGSVNSSSYVTKVIMSTRETPSKNIHAPHTCFLPKFIVLLKLWPLSMDECWQGLPCAVQICSMKFHDVQHCPLPNTFTKQQNLIWNFWAREIVFSKLSK
jgi:hypothetical protein